MARTEIHPIKTTLNLAIDYIINPEKTNDYELCSTYECTLQCASIDFEDEFLKGTGRGDTLAKHIVQSFKPGEISPEDAHRVGRELCDKYLKGNYQYVIATHVDKSHIHNHIIFNNVSLNEHKTFEYLENRGGKSAENLRRISDEICEEHGLSVIQNPERGTSKCYYEWQQDKLGNSWKSKLKSAIDSAVKKSENFEQFLENMTAQGYEYKQGKYLSFRAQGQEKFTRCKRNTLGWYYEQPQIEKRIERYNSLKNGTISTHRSKIIDTSSEKIQSSKGLERWAIIRNMQEASKMINLLTEKGVSSVEELEDKLMHIHGNRLQLAEKLNDLQDKINSTSDLVKLLETYREYKPLYAEYKAAIFKEKFRSSHGAEIAKYESALRKLKELYPDNKIPQLESERKKLYDMIDERNEKNKEYKSMRNEIDELETARKSIEDYLDNQRKNEISH